MKHYYYEGGIGDILVRLHSHNDLETMKVGDCIWIFSNNSNAYTCFPDLVNKHQFPHNLRDTFNPAKRFESGARDIYIPIYPDQPIRVCQEDFAFSDKIIYAPFSHENVHSFDVTMGSEIPREVERVFSICQVGANYDYFIGNDHLNHIEYLYPPCYNFIDQLSIVDLYNVIRHCRGVVTCMSNAVIMAWFLRKPCLLFLPESSEHLILDQRKTDPEHFGKFLTYHVYSENYKEQTKTWLKTLS